MKLKEFIVLAKKNSYADQNAEEIRLEDGSKLIKFSEDKYNYEDRYYALNASSPEYVFSGTEKVFANNKIIWIMNYTGKVLNDKIGSEKVYSFLKECLSEVKEDKPFRGPESYQKKDFKYENKVVENIRFFFGTEIIKYKGKIIYKLHYEGGIIQ